MQEKSRFNEGEQNKKDSDVQIEACVEVKEQFGPRREDGDKQQIGREVPVSEGTRHGWSKLVGWVDNHVPRRSPGQIGGGSGHVYGK